MICVALLMPLPAAAEDAHAHALARWRDAVEMMRDGQPRDALPILTALNRAAPDTPAIKLELALAHYRLGEDAPARRLFREARRLDLSATQRRATEHYLKEIERRQPWQFSFSAGLMPKSNASRRTSDERVMIGGMAFVLDDRAESGTGLTFRIGATWRDPPKRPFRFGIGAVFAGEAFENRAWNDYSLTLDGSLLTGAVQTGQTTFGLIARQRWLSDKPHSFDFGPFVNHVRAIGARSALSFRMELLNREGLTTARRDAVVGRFALGIGHRVSDRRDLRAVLSVTRTNAGLERDSGLVVGLDLGVTQKMGESWSLSADATVLHEKRDGPLVAFGLARDELEGRLRMKMSSDRIEIGGFQPVIEFGVERRHSNISILSWTNHYAGLSFQRKF